MDAKQQSTVSSVLALSEPYEPYESCCPRLYASVQLMQGVMYMRTVSGHGVTVEESLETMAESLIARPALDRSPLDLVDLKDSLIYTSRSIVCTDSHIIELSIKTASSSQNTMSLHLSM